MNPSLSDVYDSPGPETLSMLQLSTAVSLFPLLFFALTLGLSLKFCLYSPSLLLQSFLLAFDPLLFTSFENGLTLLTFSLKSFLTCLAIFFYTPGGTSGQVLGTCLERPGLILGSLL
jgi:hypothetical protein